MIKRALGSMSSYARIRGRRRNTAWSMNLRCPALLCVEETAVTNGSRLFTHFRWLKVPVSYFLCTARSSAALPTAWTLVPMCGWLPLLLFLLMLKQLHGEGGCSDPQFPGQEVTGVRQCWGNQDMQTSSAPHDGSRKRLRNTKAHTCWPTSTNQDLFLSLAPPPKASVTS